MNVPVTLALAALAGSSPAWADPPEHAPAHGYYKKHHDNDRGHRLDRHAGHYRGPSGVVYVHDYGIPAGRGAWSFRRS